MGIFWARMTSAPLSYQNQLHSAVFGTCLVKSTTLLIRSNLGHKISNMRDQVNSAELKDQREWPEVEPGQVQVG